MKKKEREKQKEKEIEKEEREKQITVTAGPFWGIISNYSYRRASAGELILQYITVGPSPGIRNVVNIAAMVEGTEVWLERAEVGSAGEGRVTEKGTRYDCQRRDLKRDQMDIGAC